jgi:hypothetical protein
LAAIAALIIVSLGFGEYYLFEENAFLKAKLADPALTKVAGWRHAALKNWGDTVAIWGMLFGILTMVAMHRWSRGLRLNFKRLEKGPYYLYPLQPLGERKRTFAVVAGLIEIAGGVSYLVAVIQAHVWEGESVRIGQIAILYGLIYWGYAILHIAVRDYRLVNYGVSATPIIMALPQADRQPDAASQAAYEKARAAMETWDQQAAMKVYRDAGLAKADAMLIVMNLGKKLQAEQPDKFALPPLSPANLSRNGMLICILIEAGVIAVLWHFNRPSYPFAAVLVFAYSFLFGTACMAFTRVKGIGKRFLLIVPGLLVMLVSEIALHPIAEQWRTFSPYMLGFFSGIMLMACGLAGEVGRAMRKKLGKHNYSVAPNASFGGQRNT